MKKVLESLSKVEQDILKTVIDLEQTKLYVVDLKKNSSEENKMVDNIYSLIKDKIKK